MSLGGVPLKFAGSNTNLETDFGAPELRVHITKQDSEARVTMPGGQRAKLSTQPLWVLGGLVTLFSLILAENILSGYPPPIYAWLALSFVSFLFAAATWTYIQIRRGRA